MPGELLSGSGGGMALGVTATMPALDALLSASAPAVPAVEMPAAVVPAIELQGFMIGTHRFLVNYLDAVEIEEVGQLTKVPAAPVWMAGLVNLHGNVMAVLDLHVLLAAAAAAAEPADGTSAPLSGAVAPASAGAAVPMLLVLHHRRDRIALLIDGMTRRMRFTAADLRTDDGTQAGAVTAAPPLYAAHVVRTLSDGAALWHELDFVALIDGLEAVAG